MLCETFNQAEIPRPAVWNRPARDGGGQVMIFGDKIMTPRLRLRRIIENDLPLLVAWSNSELAHGNYLTPDREDEARGRESIVSGRYWNEANRVFLVEQRSGKPIGTVRYWLRPERSGWAVMAIKISEPAMRNRGYGTEAQKYLIIHLFDRMKVQGVEMYTDINNRCQQRCLQKLGFELTETLSYDDHQVKRVGHLFRLSAEMYARNSVYQYHYEEEIRSGC